MNKNTTFEFMRIHEEFISVQTSKYPHLKPSDDENICESLRYMCILLIYFLCVLSLACERVE